MPSILKTTAGPAAPSASSSKLEITKLTVALNPQTGISEPIALNLPPDVASVSIFVRGSAQASYLVDHFQTGQTVITDSNPPGVSVPPASTNPFDAGQLVSPNRSMVGSVPGSAQFMAPNNPAVTVRPGPASFTVRGFADDAKPSSGTVSVEVQVKRAAKAELAKGQLPLTLYFTGADGYTAATAKTSKVIQIAVQKVKASYASAGITVGPITYADVSKSFQNPAGVADLEKMYALAKHKEGVGFFFVHRFDDATVGGASGGLPGPAMGGALKSGVAIATLGMPLDFQAPDSAGEVMGGVMSHELGHYLGLFHTADSFLQVEDSFTDTATTDATNIMFPFDRRDPHFSPMQAAVLRRHPAVKSLR